MRIFVAFGTPAGAAIRQGPANTVSAPFPYAAPAGARERFEADGYRVRAMCGEPTGLVADGEERAR